MSKPGVKTDWMWYKGFVRMTKNCYGESQTTQHLIGGIANFLTYGGKMRTLCGLEGMRCNGHKNPLCKTCKRIADKTWRKNANVEQADHTATDAAGQPMKKWFGDALAAQPEGRE